MMTSTNLSQVLIQRHHHIASMRCRVSPDISMTLGLPFHRVTEDEAMTECQAALDSGTPNHFTTANADFVARAWNSPELRKILLHSDRNFCDGQPIVWMSKLFGKPIPARVAGSDLTPRLLSLSAQRGYRVFFFGSDPATRETLERELPLLYPGLTIAGSAAPPYGDIDSWDNQSYVKLIRESKADLLLVCLGFPKQDVWIHRYLQQIGNVSLAIGIGASLDFIAGKQTRAPRWMHRTGLEWSWRLLTDPKRLAKRYAHDLVALLQIGWLQVRRHSARPLRNRGHIRVLSGANLRHTHIVRPGLQKDLAHELNEAQASSAVFDLSSTWKVDASVLSEIVTFMRVCWKEQIPAALFNAPELLERHCREMGLDRYLCFFRQPLILEAWANLFVPEIWNTPIGIKAPPSLEHDQTDADFATDLRELMAFTREDQRRLLIDLSLVEQLSTITAIRLCRHAETIRAGGMQDQGVFTDASPMSADVLEMLGLEEYLQSAMTESDFVPTLRANHVGVDLSSVSADRCWENSEAQGLVLPN